MNSALNRKFRSQQLSPLGLRNVICPICGTGFAVAEKLLTTRREDGRIFYCPNGHSMLYSGCRTGQEAEIEAANYREALIAITELEPHPFMNGSLLRQAIDIARRALQTKKREFPGKLL
ncbi:MAG: hypothetical protein ACHQ9S_18045 [Candidatus Binatia bacterium]